MTLSCLVFVAVISLAVHIIVIYDVLRQSNPARSELGELEGLKNYSIICVIYGSCVRGAGNPFGNKHIYFRLDMALQRAFLSEIVGRKYVLLFQCIKTSFESFESFLRPLHACI